MFVLREKVEKKGEANEYEKELLAEVGWVSGTVLENKHIHGMVGESVKR